MRRTHANRIVSIVISVADAFSHVDLKTRTTSFSADERGRILEYRTSQSFFERSLGYIAPSLRTAARNVSGMLKYSASTHWLFFILNRHKRREESFYSLRAQSTSFSKNSSLHKPMYGGQPTDTRFPLLGVFVEIILTRAPSFRPLLAAPRSRRGRLM